MLDPEMATGLFPERLFPPSVFPPMMFRHERDACEAVNAGRPLL
jgi:hypothetical protein